MTTFMPTVSAIPMLAAVNTAVATTMPIMMLAAVPTMMPVVVLCASATHRADRQKNRASNRYCQLAISLADLVHAKAPSFAPAGPWNPWELVARELPAVWIYLSELEINGNVPRTVDLFLERRMNTLSLQRGSAKRMRTKARLNQCFVATRAAARSGWARSNVERYASVAIFGTYRSVRRKHIARTLAELNGASTTAPISRR